MTRIGCMMVMLLSLLQSLCSQALQEKKVSITANNLAIEQILDRLTNADGINFSYQSNLRQLKKQVTLVMNDQPLSLVLSELFENSGLTYKIFANQVVIQTSFVPNHRILIEARVCASGGYDPVSYVGVELKRLRRGTIADNDGRFRLEIEDKNLDDTMRLSSLNYEIALIPVRNLADKGQHTVFLTPKVYALPNLEIKSDVGTIEEMGNHKWFRRGSLYIDTHGQQTALFIDNEKHVKGRITRVSYYLSVKGNTNAPFRVRIYTCDSLTGRPGEDMLPEIIVVKPNQGKGWFTVNISRYNLKLPAQGFFVAMEGVFPDDYDVYYQGTEFKAKTDDNEFDSDEFTDASLQYGQQLGYTRASTNKTWHYAIDRTWFQLKKGHYNVMITAGIRLNEKKKRWKIFNIFQKHENDSIDSSSAVVD